MQLELLRELMKLQKDMIIMLLSMLEGMENHCHSLSYRLNFVLFLRKRSQWTK